MPAVTVALKDLASRLEDIVARTGLVERSDAVTVAAIARTLRLLAAELAPSNPPGSGATSARTSQMVHALRSRQPYDPDEVADHLLRLDMLRISAQRTAAAANDGRDDAEARIRES